MEPLLRDETITEVMVNGPQQVYIEREGRLELTNVTFQNDEHVMKIIQRIIAPIGRRVDESSPMVDARLADGSRVNAIIPPLSLVGPVITIRKFSATPFTVEDLIRFGTSTAEMFEFLEACVKARLNIFVSGGTGSGKTTMLNILSSFIPDDERIVTIEDAAELQLRQEHVVTLEARPSNIEGKGAVPIRELVRNSLRMRPDRIVVGECRSAEALDMLQAMNTGHDGSMSTGHANTPRDMLSRLETMVLMAGMDLPLRAIREQIASAVDLIVHQNRLKDGSRKITNITEVQGMEGDVIVMQDIFVFEQTGVVEGRIQGKLKPTGIRPKFVEKFEVAGIHLPPNVFGSPF
jgi:pilus assembly protein CpaF